MNAAEHGRRSETAGARRRHLERHLGHGEGLQDRSIEPQTSLNSSLAIPSEELDQRSVQDL